jgi:hypothetical protein
MDNPGFRKIKNGMMEDWNSERLEDLDDEIME